MKNFIHGDYHVQAFYFFANNHKRALIVFSDTESYIIVLVVLLTSR